MNIVYLGAPITVNLSVGQTIAVNTNGTVTVECVSGLGLTDGATIGSIHGSATYGPFSAVGVARITATVRDGAYEVSDGQPIPIDTVLASSGQTVLDDASRAAVNLSAPPNAFGFSMIGDSRTADLLTGGGTNSRNWFNWACAYYNQTPQLVGVYGVSGKRTDEYLTNGNFEIALADGAKWLIFGLPCYNDINQSNAGYTDTYGRSITVSNVAANALDNIIVYAKRAVAAGKSVILLTEPGGSALATAAQAAAVYEFNRLIKERVKEVQGAILYDPCQLIWNPTASTTTIAFKTNYTSDGIHNQQQAARVVGKDFATNVLPAILPKIDTAPANLSDSVANSTNQLYRNPLFNTLTGGTNGGNFTLTSGNIPANMTISGTAAGLLSLVITSAANANGYGNDVTFAFTSTGVVSGRIDLDLTNADWNLTDYLEGRIEIDVAAGGTGGINGVYAEIMITTNLGALDYWANQASAAGPMSTAGDTGLVLRTRRGLPYIGSSSKTSAKLRVWVAFGAAGTQTITLRRPGVYRY